MRGEQLRQYGWVRNGGFFMHDVLDKGNTVQCVASIIAGSDWDEENGKRELSHRQLEGTFSSWTNSPIMDGMIELLLSDPDLEAYGQFHHTENALTDAKGCICVMGDAAHKMTPRQDSGAGHGIEDAVVLATSLSEVCEPQAIDATFKACDQVRRPRTQRIIASSKETGIMLCGRGADTGLDVDKARSSLPPRWGFIH